MVAAAAKAEAPKGGKSRSRSLMAISVVMPALEMAQETGKLVSWKKKAGEQVKKGEMLLEVETDKAVVEIEAQGDGILGGVTAKEGDVVPVGQTIAWLLKPGEQPPANVAAAQTGRKMDSAPAAAAAAAAPAAPEPASAAGARISPKARRLAREHGVDIATLRGSGPGGEILAEDIMKAAAASASAAPAAPPAATARPPSPPAAAPSGPPEAVSSIGRIMAERTTQSWTTRAAFLRHARSGCDRAQCHARATDPGHREVARREGHAHRSARRRRGACAASASAHERQLGQRQDHVEQSTSTSRSPWRWRTRSSRP